MANVREDGGSYDIVLKFWSFALHGGSWQCSVLSAFFKLGNTLLKRAQGRMDADVGPRHHEGQAPPAEVPRQLPGVERFSMASLLGGDESSSMTPLPNNCRMGKCNSKWHAIAAGLHAGIYEMWEEAERLVSRHSKDKRTEAMQSNGCNGNSIIMEGNVRQLIVRTL